MSNEASKFEFPRQAIRDVTEGLPADIRQAYPEHIFEPERIEIARELVFKEFLKLFPFLDADQFSQMDQTMIGWLDGRDRELAPVHDYWNFLDGTMLSLKLKDIVPLLTSANISWQQERLDPKTLSLYWPVGTLGELGEQTGYSYDFVKERVIDQPDVYAKNLAISDEKSAHTVINRDNFPIIVVRDLEGKTTLVDGNRRIMRAWLHDAPDINAWVGTITAEPLLKDHWVPTGELRRLITQYGYDPREEVKNSVRSQLELLFAASSIARYHYKLRCQDKPYAGELSEGLLD